MVRFPWIRSASTAVWALVGVGVFLWLPWQGFLLYALYEGKGKDVESVLMVLQPLTLGFCCLPVGLLFLVAVALSIVRLRSKSSET